MSKYIDTDNIEYHYLPIPAIGDTYVTKKEIDDIPAADVEEVRHGKWVTITVPRHDPHGEKFLLCTNCEHMWRKELLIDVASGNLPKRCPECGAKMDGGKEE